MPMRPRIGITTGDPAGIGPEIIRAALASGRLPEDGDYEVIGEADGFLVRQAHARERARRAGGARRRPSAARARASSTRS